MLPDPAALSSELKGTSPSKRGSTYSPLEKSELMQKDQQEGYRAYEADQK